MIRRVVFFLLGLLYSHLLFAQSPANYQNYLKMPTVLPPSPDVAAIEKFGNIPVSYSTGVPDISIPVWNISCGNISWPLALSYHAGGIRVDEVASNVGLGWSFTGPGTISRSVVGRPDEYDIGEPDFTNVDNEDYQYLYNVRDGKIDSEYDIFNYSFNGRSGKFIIKQDGTIFPIPYTAMKISNNSLSSFLITDEMGITYLFDKKENVDAELQSMPLPSYTSSWYLSKIEMPDKLQKIEFTYSTAGYTSQNYRNFTHFLGSKHISPNTTQFFNESGFTVTAQRTTSQLLTGITFPNGNIVINYSNDRQDKSGSALQRITEIVVNRNTGTGSEQVKKISLNHSYFYYKPPNITNNHLTQYRLKLTGINEYGINSANPKVYIFNYNSTPLVPRENFGQDKWGFNNGIYYNQTLIPTQTAYWQGTPYTIGSANRSVDPSAMQGWMLTEIQWPAGGKTGFTYEPHQYYAGQVISLSSETVAAVGDIRLSDTKTFNYPSSNAFHPRIKIHISRYNFTGVTAPSQITVKDLTTNTQIYFVSNTNAEQYLDADNSIQLIPGHSYEIKAELFTTSANGQLKATAEIQWQNYTSQPSIETGGGMRIKEIKNYTAGNVLATTEKYEYEPATTLTPYSFIKQSYTELINRLGFTSEEHGGTICAYQNSGINYLYHAASIFPISTVLGSAMLYKKVTKISTNQSGAINNGRSEYEYDVVVDNFLPLSSSYFYTIPISNEWKNGFLKKELEYKNTNGVFTLVKKKENYYSGHKLNEAFSLKVFGKFVHEGCETQDQSFVDMDIEYFTYPIQSGIMKLLKSEETLYDGDGQISTVTECEYTGPSHDFMTRTIITDSKKKQRSVNYKYPADFATPGNVNEKMVNQNIIAPVIEQKEFYDLILLNTVKNNYNDWLNDGKVLKLQTVVASIHSNTLENRVKIYNYDVYGNQREISKENDVHEVYLWGYKSQYPVAKILNTTYDVAKTYVTQSILDNPVDDASLRIHLNNLRNIPDALVTIYTYSPLIGMTSETGPNGRTIYYSYDAFGRLQLVKDQDGKILKKYCYNYAGQQEACGVFTNIAKSGTFTRNNCTSGYVGSNVTYTVPAGTYTSIVSQTDADQQAQNDVNANGQAYANATGTCTQPTCNTTTCSGANKRCVNGNCETGIKIYTDSVPKPGGGYTCTYHYEWSDGYWSDDFIENSSMECPL